MPSQVTRVQSDVLYLLALSDKQPKKPESMNFIMIHEPNIYISEASSSTIYRLQNIYLINFLPMD